MGGLAFLLYANTLGHGFVLDDPLILEQNKYVTKGLSGIPDLFFKSYRAEVADGAATGFLYRPLSPVLFAIEWALGGGKPFIFHLMQVIWYAASSILAYKTLRLLLKDYAWQISAATACLFVVHPLHTEVVANIKSRDEILALFFGLGALYTWLIWRANSEWKWLMISLSSFFLALISKESAITLLPVFPLADWFFGSKSVKESIKSLGLAAIPVIAFLLLRAAVHAGFSGTQTIDLMDNPIVGATSMGQRTATGFMVLFTYLKLLLIPNPLICDYSYNHLAIVDWPNLLSILGAVLFIGAGIWAVLNVQNRKALSFFILAFLSAVSLYSQLVIVIGTLLGERLMYMPSLWFCGAIAFGLSYVFKEKKDLVLYSCIGISAIFACLAIGRNADWKDNLTLFSADVAKAENSVRLHNGVASETYKRYLAAGQPVAQSQNIQTVLTQHANAANAIKPNPVSYINLGLAALEKKDYSAAELAMTKALDLSPNLAVAKQNLIVIYLNWARFEAREKQNMPQAIQLYEKLIALGHAPADVIQDLGTAYAISGNHAKAIENFEKCIQLGSKDAGLRRNLALSYRFMGDIEKATKLENGE